MKYREANILDASGITKVKVNTWKTAYKGIMSEEYLQSLSYKDKEKNWRHRLENPTHGAKIFIAETKQNKIVGFGLATLEKLILVLDYSKERDIKENYVRFMFLKNIKIKKLERN